MERNHVTEYPDIIPIHSETSLEDLRAQIEEEVRNAEKMTEWPDI